MKDRLTEILERQKLLLNRFLKLEDSDIKFADNSNKNFRQYFDYIFYKMIEEYFEAIMTFKFKKHSDEQKEFNREEFLEEMVDGLHYFNNLMIMQNITADELYNAYVKKNIVNHARINRKLYSDKPISNLTADAIIIGGGISGLVAAYIYSKKYPEKSFIIISDKLGGQIDRELSLGPRLVQKGPYTTTLLDDLSIKANTKKALIGYMSGKNIEDVFSEEFAETYSIKTRGDNNSSESLSGKSKNLEYYDIEYSDLIDRLVQYLLRNKNARILYSFVENINFEEDKLIISAIDTKKTEFVIDTSTAKTKISTIPINIFSKLGNIYEDISDKFIMSNFYTATSSNEKYLEYDYIYSTDKLVDRITKQNDGSLVVESTKNIENNIILDISVKNKLATIPKIKNWYNSNIISSFDINSHDGYDKYLDWYMLGRFAQLNGKIKLEQVLERLNDII